MPITKKGELQGRMSIKVIEPILQDKSIEVTQNGVQTIIADDDYDGLKEVEIITDVPLPSGTININQNGITDVKDYANADVNVQPKLQSKNVSPTTSQQIIEADDIYDGLDKVTVTGVDNTIDSNIQSNNIKSGVSILGINGNVVELNGQTKTVAPTTSEQIIEPDSGHNALTQVTVEAIATETKIVKSTTSAQTITPTVGKLINEIIVNPLDLETVNVTPSSSAQTITPTAGKDGIGQVNVGAVPAPNLQNKSQTITENTTIIIEADNGYDGLGTVTVTTNVPQSGVPDWSQIGYNSPPQILLDDFAHSKEIYDNWDSTQINLRQKFYQDKQLVYMPMVTVASDAIRTDDMFAYCEKLEVVPLLNLSNVSNPTGMFRECSNLRSIAQINLGNAYSIENLFVACKSLKTVPLINFENVTNARSAFSTCLSLQSVPLFNLSKLQLASYMFQSCSQLTEIPQFDTSNVTDMTGMFSSCSNLVTVPLLSTSSTQRMQVMFYGCNNLSNDSLNNILRMCINATNYTQTKTLRYLGLSSAQATICQSLSNWDDFVAAGWSSGY